ncbi:STAS domain-containing protein [Streptomyces rochei]|uniref:STAS domain-containing protein n=1 Tax=Streptomyces rochei TaxID=1928 RepID=UPI003685900D
MKGRHESGSATEAVPTGTATLARTPTRVGLEFCDSSGITAMIAAHNHALPAQADVALAAVPGHILRVLRLVGLDQILALHPDGEAATQP